MCNECKWLGIVSKQMQNAILGHKITYASYNHASWSNHCLGGLNVNTNIKFPQHMKDTQQEGK